MLFVDRARSVCSAHLVSGDSASHKHVHVNARQEKCATVVSTFIGVGARRNLLTLSRRHANSSFVALAGQALCMRRMSTFKAPNIVRDCRGLLRWRVEAEVARGNTTCARSVAPLVHPSCSSGYHRRAPSLLWGRQAPNASTADYRCGRPQRTLTCSATLSERKHSMINFA